MHPEDRSHQEKVEALDTLTDIVAATRFRRAATELNMSPGLALMASIDAARCDYFPCV